MPLPIDHIVYGVPDLGVAMDDLGERLGVRPAPGGRHRGAGTHNALLALGSGVYLEVIAPDPTQPAPEGPRPFGLDTLAQPRLITWAAKAPDIDKRVERARAAGCDLGSVMSGSRELPSGGRLEWRLTLPPSLGDGLAPFLIDWAASRHPSRTAPKGCRLLSLRAEHPYPETLRPILAALDVDLPLLQAPTPALIATLDTPREQIELR